MPDLDQGGIGAIHCDRGFGAVVARVEIPHRHRGDGVVNIFIFVIVIFVVNDIGYMVSAMAVSMPMPMIKTMGIGIGIGVLHGIPWDVGVVQAEREPPDAGARVVTAADAEI